MRPITIRFRLRLEPPFTATFQYTNTTITCCGWTPRRARAKAAYARQLLINNTIEGNR